MHTVQRGLTLLMALLSPTLMAAAFELAPGDDVIGAIAHTRSHYEDTLMDIARRHDLGYREIRRANPSVDPLLPGSGTPITLPTQFILPAGPRQGLVLNLAEMRLYYYPPPSPPQAPQVEELEQDTELKPPQTRQVFSFPVGIGQIDWQTPTGQFHIIDKVKNPSWTPPASVHAAYLQQGVTLPQKIPPGPDNPLGKFALRLSSRNYLIHGTNKPDGIGMQVSHGCIRLYPEDISNLFSQVSIETPVTIVDHAYKVGWHGSMLLLEVHPTAYPKKRQQGRSSLIHTIIEATRYRTATVDWEQVERTRKSADGVPQVIGEATGERELAQDLQSLTH